jgi:hypothetical protein
MDHGGGGVTRGADSSKGEGHERHPCVFPNRRFYRYLPIASAHCLSAAIAVALICLLVFQASRLLMAPRGGLGFEPQMTATAGPTEALGQVSDRLHLVIP